MNENEMEERKQRVLADEYLMQQAGSRLVEKGVLHRLNSLMTDIIRHPEQAAKVFDVSYDDILNWASIPDYEEPATQAGWEEDEYGNIVKPCGELVDYPAHRHGKANDFDYWDVLDEAGGAHDVDERFNLGIDFDEAPDDDEEVWATLSDEQKARLITEYRAEYRAKYSEKADSWEDACDMDRLEPYYIEVYEYYAVDSWFAARLKEHGQLVFEFADFDVWGRTCTGQAICLDGVIRSIVKGMPAYSYVFDDL